MGWIPLDFHGIWPYKTSETLICLLFSQYWGGPKKSMISPLLIYNKFRYHTHKIRLEKLVPLNYRFPTDNKKSSTKIDQTVFKLDFWPKSGFPKIRDLSPVAPSGGLYFQKWPQTKYFLGNDTNSKNRHCLIKLLHFHVFRLFISPRCPYFEIFNFREINLKKSGFEISKNNNKGVLGRPRVLRAIPSTLKFQFTENHET